MFVDIRDSSSVLPSVHVLHRLPVSLSVTSQVIKPFNRWRRRRLWWSEPARVSYATHSVEPICRDNCQGRRLLLLVVLLQWHTFIRRRWWYRRSWKRRSAAVAMDDVFPVSLASGPRGCPDCIDLVTRDKECCSTALHFLKMLPTTNAPALRCLDVIACWMVGLFCCKCIMFHSKSLHFRKDLLSRLGGKR